MKRIIWAGTPPRANGKKEETEMANIGATTAFYKVETSLTRANNEVIRAWSDLQRVRQMNAGDDLPMLRWLIFPIGLCWDKAG